MGDETVWSQLPKFDAWSFDLQVTGNDEVNHRWRGNNTFFSRADFVGLRSIEAVLDCIFNVSDTILKHFEKKKNI